MTEHGESITDEAEHRFQHPRHKEKRGHCLQHGGTELELVLELHIRGVFLGSNERHL